MLTVDLMIMDAEIGFREERDEALPAHSFVHCEMIVDKNSVYPESRGLLHHEHVYWPGAQLNVQF